MHQTVLFVRPSDEKATFLSQEVVRHGTPIPDTKGMSTLFLVLRRYQSKATPIDVASQMLMAVDPSYIRYLNSEAFEEPWDPLETTAARTHLRQWLTEGLALESAAYDGDKDGAESFLDELYAWIGPQVSAFTNKLSVFQVPHCTDRGIVLVGPQRIALLWFLGQD